jgi:hypothetical protein
VAPSLEVSSEAGRPGAERLARVFYEFCALTGAAQLGAVAFSAAGMLSLMGTAGRLFRALVFRFGIVAPVGVAAVIILTLALRRPVPGSTFAASPYVLRGLCVTVSLAFLSTEIGKLRCGWWPHADSRSTWSERSSRTPATAIRSPTRTRPCICS